MGTSKCEAEIGLFLTATPKKERKKGEKRRKGRARGSMSERENRQEERRKIWRSRVFCFYMILAFERKL